MNLKLIYGYIPSSTKASKELLDFKEEYEDIIEWNPVFLGKKVKEIYDVYLDISLIDKKHFTIDINTSEMVQIRKKFNNLPERVSKHFNSKPGFYIVSNE